ncbi:hypothetical protein NDU88_002362 [Pleurodeles waltl]|uniref:Uncharacterized protein n=1 Tax=Pleurodeles waltl TaxID=8319 RepID=A0AAV7SCA1_PLEWA|nr:hypothetical protein NDU88_002362 [Pleurodeles waltl]
MPVSGHCHCPYISHIWVTVQHEPVPNQAGTITRQIVRSAALSAQLPEIQESSVPQGRRVPHDPAHNRQQHFSWHAAILESATPGPALPHKPEDVAAPRRGCLSRANSDLGSHALYRSDPCRPSG